MKRPHTATFGAVLCFTLSSCHSAAPVKPDNANSAPQAGLQQDPSAPARGYKSWTLVNPSPVKDPPALPGETFVGVGSFDPVAVKENDPHEGRYISVYVNETGKHALLAEKRPSFPAGSVIVAEHRNAVSDEAPVSLAAMVKRERGAVPRRGDWVFLMLGGSAGEVISSEGLAYYCYACHSDHAHMDYVFRRYLPKAVVKELK